MTNEDNISEEGEILFGPEAKTTGDWALQSLANLGAMGMGMGLTVICGGAVVSGRVISPTEYFALLAKQFRSGTTSKGMAEPVAVVADAFDGFADQLKKPDDAGDDWRPYGSDHLHLNDARFIDGAVLIPPAGMLWRGRIRDISSFSLGQITSGD